jgi:hypothetical protein
VGEVVLHVPGGLPHQPGPLFVTGSGVPQVEQARQRRFSDERLPSIDSGWSRLGLTVNVTCVSPMRASLH